MVNILVAPNGFGKSTIACAFKSLLPQRMKLSAEDIYDYELESEIKIRFKSKILSANTQYNNISKTIKVTVFNNAIKPKSKYSTAGAYLVVDDIVLYSRIPDEVEDVNVLDGVFLSLNPEFIKQSNRINFSEPEFINSLADNLSLIKRIAKSIKVRNLLENVVDEINDSLSNAILTKNDVICNSVVRLFLSEKRIVLLSKMFDRESAEIVLLNIISLIKIEERDGSYLKRKIKYHQYISFKNEINFAIKDFNTTKREVCAREKQNKLIVDFPRASTMSNGERDVLFFVTNLIKFRHDFDKNIGILIMDELFDYLDGANMLLVQFYLSKYISQFKREGKLLFPLILTHLDPEIFRHYYFKNMKIHYLKEYPALESNDMMDFLYIRNGDNEEIKEKISKYFVHYHPDLCGIEIHNEVASLNERFHSSYKFRSMLYSELEKYANEEKYNPLMVVAGVRVKIEEDLYQLLRNDKEKEDFLEIHGTREKIEFCAPLNIEIRSTYYLLSPIYNEGLHIRSSNKQRVLDALLLKLDSIAVLKMINELTNKIN